MSRFAVHDIILRIGICVSSRAITDPSYKKVFDTTSMLLKFSPVPII